MTKVAAITGGASGIGRGTAKRLLDDGWTVVTRDRRRSAQFEHTLVVTETGSEILTLP